MNALELLFYYITNTVLPGDGLELSLEEKFQKTTQEVDILKQQLGNYIYIYIY